MNWGDSGARHGVVARLRQHLVAESPNQTVAKPTINLRPSAKSADTNSNPVDFGGLNPQISQISTDRRVDYWLLQQSAERIPTDVSWG
jgi:hypothetical protein